MTHFRQAALAALLLTTLGSAQALTPVQHISFDSNAAPLDFTNWSVEALLPQFDSRLGVLEAVTITLFSHLEGSAKAESRNLVARDVALNLQATFKLTDLLSGSTWLQSTERVTNAFTAGAYDGLRDFGGDSGRSYLNLGAEGESAQTFTDGAMLARFTGSGSVSTLLSAKGESGYVSSSTFDSQFRTKASGYASVSYAYHAAAVPEPGTWVLMAAGLGLLGLRSARRSVD